MRGALTAAAILVMILVGGTSPAAAQYFGQNKVQYRAFKWRVLESEHFNLYYYESERKVAVDAARIAERAYDRLSALLEHEFAGRIPLIVYASHTDFQSTNVSPGHIHEGTQGVTELMKRRVFLPFTGSYPEFKHVLEHELVHAFQLDILLGRSDNVLTSPMSFIPPLWVMEGMAEYLSQGYVDNHTQMWLRDAALQGYLLSIADLAYVGDIRVYRFGQAIMAYIGERFGDGKIGEILKRSVHTRSFERATEEVLGLSMEKLGEDWTQHVRRTELPKVADHLKPTEFSRQLTHGRQDLSNFNLAASVDPSGERFVFISDRSLYNDLYLASAIDGTIDDRLIKGQRTGDFESLRFFHTAISWSPDGRYIALPAKDGGEDALVIYDVEKRKEVERHLTGLDGLLSPSWSPDGERLVFNGLRDGHSDLYTIRRDGSDMRRLTHNRHASDDPVWSPDGRYIAFTTDMGPDTDFEKLVFGEFRIGVYDLETGIVNVPPGQAGKCINAQWGPDGDKILFVSDRSGISNAYVMDLDGDNVRQLTNVLTGVTGLTEYSPAISLSADGSRLLFTAFAFGGFDIYAMDYPLGASDRDKSEPALEGWIVDARGLPQPNLGSVEAVGGGDDEGDSDDADQSSGGGDGDGVGEAGLLAGAASLNGSGNGSNASSPVDDRMSQAMPTSLGDFMGSTDLNRPDRARSVGSLGAEDPDAASLPDSSTFSFRKYRLKFSPDFVAANGLFASSAGIAAQTAIGFSDVLGNHRMVVGASVYGSLLDADVFLSYANLSSRTNWGLSLFQYRSDFVVSAPEGDNFVVQINRGVELAFTQPYSRFRRVEMGLEFVGIEERVFQTSFTTSLGPTTYIDIPGEGNKFFIRPRIAWVSDNVLYGSTGPISGTRSRFEVQNAMGQVNFTTFWGDYRNYINMRQRYVLATRIIGATSFGNNKQSFRIGGPYTMRGHEFGELTGSTLALANFEFRFPLIDFVKLGWPLPLAFAGIRGLMFFDVGAAWNNHTEFRPFGGSDETTGLVLNDAVAAYGFGARMNIFGFLIARWDIARKTDLNRNLSPWSGFFSIGSEF